MAVRKKTFLPESIYFITFTVLKWQKVFIGKKYADLFFKWFDYQRKNYKNKIHGYVIMPNHFHGLIYLSRKSPSLPKLIQNGKRFLAYGVVKNLEKEGNCRTLKLFSSCADKSKNAKHKVFEDRYDSKIIDDGYLFEQKLNYIHENPCQEHWKLAGVPEEYIFSSASNYYCGKGVYDGVEVLC